MANLTSAAAQNLPPALADNPRRMEGSCYCLDTFRAGDLEGAANVNIITCTRLKGLIDGTAGLRSHASVPLYAHGKRLRCVERGQQRLARVIRRGFAPALHRGRSRRDLRSSVRACLQPSTQIGALEERNRLAREIHDTLVQGLVGIIMQLELLMCSWRARKTDRGREALQPSAVPHPLESGRGTPIRVRFARGSLKGRSLAKALVALVDEWKTKSNLKISLN